MELHEYTQDFVGRCVTGQTAWSFLRKLCEEVGTRLSGSEEEGRAARLLAEQMARAGLETMTEEFSYLGWRPGTSRVQHREGPRTRAIPSHPLGWSPGETVEAPVADMGRGMKEDSLDKVDPESFTLPLLVAGAALIECAMRDVRFPVPA